MRALMDRVMYRRARRLARQLGGTLRGVTSLADIGSGTGHNGSVLRGGGLEVEEFDVVDMHWVGPGPEIFDGLFVPCDDDSVDAASLVFVLQYASDPQQLLREARRIAGKRVIVLQSSFESSLGRVVLGVREYFWGPVALAVARLFGLVGNFESSLVTRRHFTRAELVELFNSAGLAVESCAPDRWPGLGVSRDLFVLRPGSLEPEPEPRPQTASGRRRAV